MADALTYDLLFDAVKGLVADGHQFHTNPYGHVIVPLSKASVLIPAVGIVDPATGEVFGQVGGRRDGTTCLTCPRTHQPYGEDLR